MKPAKPVIQVWCLPELTEEKLNNLHKKLVAAIVVVQQLELKSEEDMIMLFPPDMMKYGLGSEIVVEVDGLFSKAKRTDGVRKELAKNIGEAARQLFPNAFVECFVHPFNPDQGFWSSSDEMQSYGFINTNTRLWRVFFIIQNFPIPNITHSLLVFESPL